MTARRFSAWPSFVLLLATCSLVPIAAGEYIFVDGMPF